MILLCKNTLLHLYAFIDFIHPNSVNWPAQSDEGLQAYADNRGSCWCGIRAFLLEFLL